MSSLGNCILSEFTFIWKINKLHHQLDILNMVYIIEQITGTFKSQNNWKSGSNKTLVNLEVFSDEMNELK